MATIPVTFSRWTMRKLLLSYALQNVRPRWIWLHPSSLARLVWAVVSQKAITLEIGVTTIEG